MSSSTSSARPTGSGNACGIGRGDRPIAAASTTTNLGELNDAFNHFFFHYTGAPLLVVETSSLDLDWQDEDVEDLLRQIEHMQQGTQYYVPRQR